MSAQRMGELSLTAENFQENILGTFPLKTRDGLKDFLELYLPQGADNNEPP
jgi:hypothetical protein